MIVMTIVLLVPIVPLLFVGDRLDVAAQRWINQPHDRWTVAAIVAGALTADILLPIPSSALSTIAGAKIGAPLGALASWIGMSAGAVAAFAVTRRWGRPLALRLATAGELERMEQVTERYGPLTLVLTRAVPVLAEASVLIVGVHRLSWRRFLPPVFAANFGVSLAYAWLGEIAEQQQWLGLALATAVGLPVLATLAARRAISTRINGLSNDTTDHNERLNPPSDEKQTDHDDQPTTARR